MTKMISEWPEGILPNSLLVEGWLAFHHLLAWSHCDNHWKMSVDFHLDTGFCAFFDRLGAIWNFVLFTGVSSDVFLDCVLRITSENMLSLLAF